MDARGHIGRDAVINRTATPIRHDVNPATMRHKRQKEEAGPQIKSGATAGFEFDGLTR